MKNIELNLLQALSVTGIVVSSVAQLGLQVLDKHVEKFWALYPTWVAVFIFGTILRYLRNDSEEAH
ncbi:hypothetical protein SAMN05421780_103114 [Flexibacter flexilis DSM 6793]|uniref:Uncharacterized protein n=1 Tax=Flexibacter flexilis DSM 6793 TaxID=927664 RepID=A0A1I1GW36_9BACT|nr:hypothetical protein [Flexibacter flexilis]SFC15884.1 hypothetical protein SAMN05421780_103114 [Flexibacter flexilis DSM 6793]